MVLGKNPPGKKTPALKPNPIPNPTLTLHLSPHGGLFPGGFFPDTVLYMLKIFEHTLMVLCN